MKPIWRAAIERDDMLQERNILREQLGCTILVSHRVEFANAFPDRYSFKLEKMPLMSL